jgi:hypothetical protein
MGINILYYLEMGLVRMIAKNKKHPSPNIEIMNIPILINIFTRLLFILIPEIR